MRAAVAAHTTTAPPPVVAAAAEFEALASACARRLGAARLERAAWERLDPAPLVVWCDDAGPALRGAPASAAPRRPEPPAARRPGRDPLLRALGPVAGAVVIDATAGWGADAGVIAAAGARVRMIERQPVMALLLEAALERWRATGVEAAPRLELVEGDARAVLATCADADLVYLDPLFPGREERRTSTQALRWLRALAHAGQETEEDEGALLCAARARARRRVVVKRARSDPPLAGVAPSGSVVGRTNRYDIYAGRAGHTP